MKTILIKLTIALSLVSFSFGVNAAKGNCDAIDKAPERMRAKLEKMCAGRNERKGKAEQKAAKLNAWSKDYFGGGKKKAVYEIYKKHNTWLWPCKGYATDCKIDELQITKGIGNEIYRKGTNVVFLFKDAAKGNPVVTCHKYVVDDSGEKMISRESEICGTY